MLLSNRHGLYVPFHQEVVSVFCRFYKFSNYEFFPQRETLWSQIASVTRSHVYKVDTFIGFMAAYVLLLNLPLKKMNPDRGLELLK